MGILILALQQGRAKGLEGQDADDLRIEVVGKGTPNTQAVAANALFKRGWRLVSVVSVEPSMYNRNSDKEAWFQKME